MKDVQYQKLAKRVNLVVAMTEFHLLWIKIRKAALKRIATRRFSVAAQTIRHQQKEMIMKAVPHQNLLASNPNMDVVMTILQMLKDPMEKVVRNQRPQRQKKIAVPPNLDVVQTIQLLQKEKITKGVTYSKTTVKNPISSVAQMVSLLRKVLASRDARCLAQTAPSAVALMEKHHRMVQTGKDVAWSMNMDVVPTTSLPQEVHNSRDVVVIILHLDVAQIIVHWPRDRIMRVVIVDILPMVAVLMTSQLLKDQTSKVVLAKHSNLAVVLMALVLLRVQTNLVVTVPTQSLDAAQMN